MKGTWDMGFRFSRLGTDTLLHEAAVGAPFQGANLAKQGIAQVGLTFSENFVASLRSVRASRCAPTAAL